MIEVRRFAPHEWATYKDLRLRALADSPDAFARTLAEEQERSDAEWLNRLVTGANSRGELALVAEADGQPIGLAWGRIDEGTPDVATLYQMWVAPSHRRQGTGQALLDAAIAWARAKAARYLDLGVTYGDSSAMRLYARAGFQPVGRPQPLRPGSELLSQPMRLKLKPGS